MPKQFLQNIFGEETLFTKALKLVNNPEIFLPPMTITNKEHKFFVLEEYKSLGIKAENILLEPCSKNTAIAVMLACLRAQKFYNQEKLQLLILPSDHLIEPKELFWQSVLSAKEAVEDNIVTFGVKPDFAATGYGYIKKSAPISGNCFKVEKFTEKPDEQTAKSFMQSGDYFWNAGIFLLQSDLYLNEAEKFLPEQLKIARNAIENSRAKNGFYNVDYEDYQPAQDISIDYGILEKSQNVAVVPLKAKWSDVGDFSSIYRVSAKDQKNNAVFGDVRSYDSSNSLIYSYNKLITCMGLDNIVVVESDDAILVADKNRTQDIKKIVGDLSSQNHDKAKFHNKVFRPWGYYETIAEEGFFKVKKISVNPGSSLSLQLHQFRSEHWVVIKGQAKVQNGEDLINLEVNQATFIPAKTKHRLTNESDQILEIVEIQIGSYLGEDDITRFEDVYNRN